MYAAAALQNLAASYCDTPNDGTCHWEWTAQSADIQLNPNSPLVSDATPMRKRIMEIDGLVDELIELACEDPIFEEFVEESARPGYDAVAGEHGEWVWDRRLISRIDTDQDQRVLVSALLAMSERLGIETLAEGVETQNEHAMLAQLGCDHIQGFGLARPMPRGDSLTWITDYQMNLATRQVLPTQTAK